MALLLIRDLHVLNIVHPLGLCISCISVPNKETEAVAEELGASDKELPQPHPTSALRLLDNQHPEQNGHIG